MKLDRTLQQQLLKAAREKYPDHITLSEVFPEKAPNKKNISQWIHYSAQLRYLEGHGLLKIEGSLPHIHPDSPITVTCKGLDFLEDDGGLSAILGVVTVRLHADTIRDMVEAKILASDAPQPEKRRMIDVLKSLPEEGLKQLNNRLIDAALNQTPQVWDLLAKTLSSLG